MKVDSPLGEYPLAFRRIERRPGGLAVVGMVAGIESSVVIDERDLRTAARVLATALGGAALIIAWRSRR
jgi:hypothetical protein